MSDVVVDVHSVGNQDTVSDNNRGTRPYSCILPDEAVIPNPDATSVSHYYDLSTDVNMGADRYRSFVSSKILDTAGAMQMNILTNSTLCFLP